MNLVAADVSPRILSPMKVSADSRRRLRFRGLMREVLFWGNLSRDLGHCFGDNRVAVLVGWRAAAQQSQRFVANIPKLVFAAGRDGYGVASFHVARFAFDANPSRAVCDVINFLGFDVIMFL